MSTVTELEKVERKEKVGFRHIVVATDFSAASRRALDHAIAIARRYGAEISLVHAIAPEPRQSVPIDPLPHALDRRRFEAQQKMGPLAEEAHIRDFRIQVLPGHGSVWDVLSSILQNEQVDLLVLGTHGRGGLKKLALGSVAEEVLRLASCPVLTVGPNAAPPASDIADFKSILFATDFGPASAKALPYALFLARDCRARFVLLHMVPPMSAAETGYGMAAFAAEDLVACQEQIRKESLKRLKGLIPTDANPPVAAEFLVETNFLPDGILDVATTHEAELIIMGANRASSARLAAHIPWAVTHDVLCEAKCPVVTVSG